jgi:hypothetical protein
MLLDNEVFGFVRPGVDAHTLGVAGVAKLLSDCGYTVHIGDADVCNAVETITRLNSSALLRKWILTQGITRLGYSNRLDPGQAQLNFGRFFHQLGEHRLLAANGGPIRAVYFAGLPSACAAITEEYRGAVLAFVGDGTPMETLSRLGVPADRIPRNVAEGSAYDDARMQFGRNLISRGEYLKSPPPPRGGYPQFGKANDTVVARIQHARRHGTGPLMRAHVGPFLPDRMEALRSYKSWVASLAQSGHLDVLSIGSSQLTQAKFGENWDGIANGGGVPVNSADEYREIWEAARPMLVRTYAGTARIPELARVHEEAINIAWHALSFWWFCRIDGRGPYSVRENLEQHCETLRYIASTNKPFEPNIPHHFSFRGADDVTYVLSALLAVKTAKKIGVRHLILQVMLNTPRQTWGVQDLAKARALLRLVRELEDKKFSVHLQPRAGLDYFSPDLLKAKAQLAAVSALIDDIEPNDPHSPAIIHVVSYSEAVELATPAIVDESIQITRTALQEYRRLRAGGAVEDMTHNRDVKERETQLVAEVRHVLAVIESAVSDPYSPAGLYRIFAAGFLPVPYLWECRDEFKHAVQWKTSMARGSVVVVDETGKAVPAASRAAIAADIARKHGTTTIAI